LTPKQSTSVSKTIAHLTQLDDGVILDQIMSHITADDMLDGVRLNQQLQHMLQQDHLEEWFKTVSIDNDQNKQGMTT